MKEQLKTQLTTIANIDVNKAFPSEVINIIGNSLLKQQEEAKQALCEHSFSCVSKHPVMILCSPCGNLYIKEFVTDSKGQVVSVITTSSFTEAEKVSADWAENNCKHFKNGADEQYVPLTVKQAAVNSGEMIVKNFKLYLGNKVSNLSDCLDVSLWSGDFEKVSTTL